jgi:hypothetical protein
MLRSAKPVLVPAILTSVNVIERAWYPMACDSIIFYIGNRVSYFDNYEIHTMMLPTAFEV